MADKKDAKDQPKTPRSKKKAEEAEELKSAPNFTARRTIVSSKTVGNVTIREFENVNEINGAPMIEGFPTVGMSCSLVTNFLLKKLKLPQVADITSDEFPVSGIVSSFQAGNGVRIYGNSKICVVASDFQLTDAADEVVRSLVQCVLDFAARHGCKLVITADGLSSEKKGGLQIGGGEGDDEEGGGGISINLGDLDEEDEEERKKKKKEKKKKEAEKKKHGKDKSAPAAAEKPDEKKEKKQESEKKKHFGPKLKISEDDDDEDGEDEDEEDDKVFFMTNEQKLGDQIRAMGFDPCREAILHGVTGGLVAELQTSPLQIVCLISATAKNSLTDARNSVEILKIISTLTNIGPLDESCLVADVQKIEIQLKKVLTALKNGMNKGKDHTRSMYM